jgi:hypothetical protein
VVFVLHVILLVSVKVALKLHKFALFAKTIIIQIKVVFVKLVLLYHIVHNVIQHLENAHYVIQAITLKMENVKNVQY